MAAHSTTVDVEVAARTLSQLVDRAAAGEEIVVARNGRPVVRLTALEPEPKRRRGGWARGEIVIGPDFDAPLPELNPVTEKP